jgi:cytochrome b6-f complex iron-sulfur subunit
MSDDNTEEQQPDEPAAEPAAEPAPKPAAKAAKAEPAAKPERAVARPGGAVAAGAGGPAVVVVPQPAAGMAMPQVSRRRVLAIGFWAGLGAMMLGIVYAILQILYPRGITGFGSSVFVGTVDQLAPGDKLHNLDAKAWVVRFDADQAAHTGAPEGSILALYHRCVHLGCTVPFRSDYTFEGYQGWFLCPCHGSTYDDAGVRVFGPAPRSLDTFEMTIDGGNITVNTGTINSGAEDNPTRAILPS